MDQKPNSTVTIGTARFGNELPIALIAGPCALESKAHALEMATALREIAGRVGIGLVYKTSFDKANRTSAKSARGLGLEQALPIFAEIRDKLKLPVLTDVHEATQCGPVAEVVDVLQIPAFLCRQTDLLVAAAKTGKAVNVKKGQFMAPWDMQNVVEKITGAGNRNVLVTERGASFGYNMLVSDMRSIPILKRTTLAPVIFDATHSVQQPGGQGTSSGGEREFVSVLARAAVAVGVAGVFIETHQDPDKAPSDGPNMMPLKEMEPLLRVLLFMRSVDPVIPQVASGLKVEPTTAALLSTGFTLPYALIQPVLGALADMFSKARLIAVCMLIGGITTLACGMVTNFETLMGLRVLAGMTAGGVFPIAFALVGDRVPVAKRQIAFGKLLFAAMSGNLLGASGAGVIGDLIGWRGGLHRSDILVRSVSLHGRTVER